MKTTLRTTAAHGRHCLAFLAFFFLLSAHAATSHAPGPDGHDTVTRIAWKLKVGDVVFIDVKPLPFQKVSEATASWVNHVGVVIDVSGNDPVIAESTFPFSRTTRFSRFVARSIGRRVAVMRLDTLLTWRQEEAVRSASEKRMGIRYDTGFNLHSRGQFCSRFVREVMAEATGVTLGETETFGALLAGNPDVRLGFWQAWYFGRIPWQRETITPASLLRSNRLRPVFDGSAV